MALSAALIAGLGSCDFLEQTEIPTRPPTISSVVLKT